MSDIDKLRALVEAASARPWRVTPSGMVVTEDTSSDAMLVHGYILESPHTISRDAEAAAALRNIAPEMLAVVDAQVIVLDYDGELLPRHEWAEGAVARMCVCCGVEQGVEGCDLADLSAPFPHGIGCPVAALDAKLAEVLP